jgi:hypothetical protein
MTLLLVAMLAAPLPVEPVTLPDKGSMQLGKNVGGHGAPNVTWDFNGAPKDGFDGVRIAIAPQSYEGDKKNFIYWAYDGVYMNGKTYYAGLQPNGEFGHTALFSVFGAGTHPKAPHCKAGADMGSGTSCHIPYEWLEGRAYEFTIQMIDSDSDSTTWEGAVVDLTTKNRTVIGVVQTGKDRGLLKPWATTFAEVYKGPKDCKERQKSEVLFYRPVAYRNGREYPAVLRGVNTNSGCVAFYGDGKNYVFVDSD